MPRRPTTGGRPDRRRRTAPGRDRRRGQAASPADRLPLGPDLSAALLPAARGRCDGARARIAYEAARIMAEQGETRYERARRKAAERNGVADRRCWPDNAEIDAALHEQLRLFHADRQQRVMRDLHGQALQAMQALAAFDPRLVGRAAAGTASRDEGIQLHLFADDPAEVLFTLMDRGIRFEERDAELRFADGQRQSHPAVGFLAGEVPVELIVLPRSARRNPPLSPVTDRPERGLPAGELARLMGARSDGER